MTPGGPGRGWYPEEPVVPGIPAGRLYGRDRELGVLENLTDRLGEGAGGALVVRGEPGIGKSALLAAVAARAGNRGTLVLSAAGVQSETHLPFAGLHQLLRPVLHLAEDLPVRQRTALLTAFGMADEAAPEMFLVGLAVLELIGGVADSSPVLLVADDVQWLDDPSSAVLAFVARRLAAEPALLLIALRDGDQSPFDDAGVAEVRVAALPEDAASAVLELHAPDLDPGRRERVLVEAAGNPLALIELPAAIRSEHLGEGAPSRAPLSARLEGAFAVQEAGLATATRWLLLAAAADDSGELADALKAATILEGATVTADALGPAVAAQLVEVDGTRLRFRHPLARSAIYQAAGASRRRAAHAALADLLADQPDRRVWHRAAAAQGPDEQVAAELDATAARAGRRGAGAVAINALRRAAHLSAGPASRGRRLLQAAQVAFESGQAGAGAELLRAADRLDLPAEDRMWLSWLQEAYAEAGWSGVAKIASFVEQAEQMRAAGHADLAVQSLLAIALRCYWGNPGQPTRSAVIAAAESMPVPQATRLC